MAFEATLKFIKKSKLSSNFLHKIKTFICIRKKLYKIKNFLITNFDKVNQIPCTVIRDFGPILSDFKNSYKKLKLDQNLIKLDTQHRNIYTFQIIIIENSLLAIFDLYTLAACNFKY